MKKTVGLGLSLCFILLLACIQACNNNPNPAFAVHPCSNSGSFGPLAGAPVSFGPCTIFASPYTLTQNADVFQLEAYGMAGTFDAGLYTDFGGAPGNLIFSTADINGAGVSQTQTIPISPVGLSPGTYWLAIGAQSPVTFSLVLGSGFVEYGPGCGTHSLPSSFSGPITAAAELSLKADYCY